MTTERWMVWASVPLVVGAAILLLLGGFITVWDSDAGEDVFITRIVPEASVVLIASALASVACGVALRKRRALWIVIAITFAGRDARTNEVLPPAVPVNEPLEVIGATVATADGRHVRDIVTHHHPLQPSDRRCFIAGALGTDGPWGFDRQMLAGARAAQKPRLHVPGFLEHPLASASGGASGRGLGCVPASRSVSSRGRFAMSGASHASSRAQSDVVRARTLLRQLGRYQVVPFAPPMRS